MSGIKGKKPTIKLCRVLPKSVTPKLISEKLIITSNTPSLLVFVSFYENMASLPKIRPSLFGIIPRCLFVLISIKYYILQPFSPLFISFSLIQMRVYRNRM